MKVSAKQLAKVVMGCNLQSLGYLLWGRPGVFFGSSAQSYETSKLWKPWGKDAAIPSITLGQILGSRRPVVTMTVRSYEEGMLPVEDALVLVAVLVAESPKEVLEIGTFMGHTTRLMAENCASAVVHTVDLPLDYDAGKDADATTPKDDFHLIERRVVGREFQATPCAEHIRQHFADTSKWDFADCGRPTFFFIDGSHTYEHCKSDSEKCFDLCGGKGVFFWHDVNELHPGVLKFINEWRSRGRDIRRVRGTDLGYWKS